MKHEIYSSDEAQYIVRNNKEIIQILSELVKQKAMLKISFDAGLGECLTSIIEMDTKNNVLYLDIGLDEIFNSRLLASNYVLFSKEEGVKIKWASQHVSMATLNDGKAIKIALPEYLIRLQRREYFRLATPVLNPASCQIPIINESHPESSKTLSLTLADVSLGGAGFVVHDTPESALEVGSSFNGCQIELPEIGVVNLTLQVKSVVPIAMKDGTIKYRIGCLFAKPSLANEALLHRYTFNLERELCSRTWNPVS